MIQTPTSDTNAISNESGPILFHDGCRICLGIAETLQQTMPGLQVVDLGLHPERKPEAVARGIEELPSLVIGTRVLSVSPHSDIGHIDATAAMAT